MIITSTHTEGAPEADGRIPIFETHKLDDGRTFTYNWLKGVNHNVATVLSERATVIRTELVKREAARALVTGTEVPYTKHEFLSRFTTAERIAIRTRAKTDDNLNDFMEMLNASGGVYMSKARDGINYLQSVGILTAARAVIVGGA